MSKACCDVPKSNDWKKSKALWSALAIAVAWVISTSFQPLEPFRRVLEHDFHVMLLQLIL